MPSINIGNLENQEKILELLQILYTSQFNPSKFDWGTFFGTRRTGELFSTKFYNHSKTDSGIGIMMNDSEGHVCKPSTDKVKERDDFEHHNAFWYCLCNFKVDNQGVKIPTAIEGQSGFKRTGAVDVGVLTPPLYWGEEFVEDGYIKHFSDSEVPNKRPDLKLTLMPHCRDNKGNPMPYGIVSAYYAGEIEGILYGSSGLAVKNFMSYDALHTAMGKKGEGYVGAGSERSAYLKNFLWIKYKTLNSQSVFPGATNYNTQVKVAKAESEVMYVTIAKASLGTIYVGCTVSIGTNTTAAAPDRQQTNIASNLANLVKVTKIEDADEGVNVRVYVDAPKAFTTTENTYISTMSLHSGQTDFVLGNDGQVADDGKHSFRIQGVEDGIGAYMVSGNELLHKNTATNTILYNRNGAETYTNTDPSGSGWKEVAHYDNTGSQDIWIAEETVDLETGSTFVRTVGTSGAKDIGDRYYYGSTGTGIREYLTRGYLRNTSSAGLSCLNGWHGVGRADWDLAAAVS